MFEIRQPEGSASSGETCGPTRQWDEPMSRARPFAISKQSVWAAWLQVKANHGAHGVDGQTIEAFEEQLGRNLYKLWNRIYLGCYFPPPVVKWRSRRATAGIASGYWGCPL